MRTLLIISFFVIATGSDAFALFNKKKVEALEKKIEALTHQVRVNQKTIVALKKALKKEKKETAETKQAFKRFIKHYVVYEVDLKKEKASPTIHGLKVV